LKWSAPVPSHANPAFNLKNRRAQAQAVFLHPNSQYWSGSQRIPYCETMTGDTAKTAILLAPIPAIQKSTTKARKGGQKNVVIQDISLDLNIHSN
jgi:hypothetical protein